MATSGTALPAFSIAVHIASSSTSSSRASSSCGLPRKTPVTAIPSRVDIRGAPTATRSLSHPVRDRSAPPCSPQNRVRLTPSQSVPSFRATAYLSHMPNPGHLRGSAGKHDSETRRASPRGLEQPSTCATLRAHRKSTESAGTWRGVPCARLRVKVGTMHIYRCQSGERGGCTDSPCHFCGEYCSLRFEFHRAYDGLSLLPLIKINSTSRRRLACDNNFLRSLKIRKVSYYLSGCCNRVLLLGQEL